MLRDSADMRWFAMRATYGRNLMAQRGLELQKIESFVPMRKHTTKVGRRIKTELQPVVRDLIFVLGAREDVQEAKGRIPYLHYITHPVDGRNIPVEVPTEQMEQFMALCNDMGDDAEVIEGDNARFAVGDRVRVKEGSFRGQEGYLVKIEGRRSKRFVVAIEGIIAISVSGIRAEDIEKIER